MRPATERSSRAERATEGSSRPERVDEYRPPARPRLIGPSWRPAALAAIGLCVVVFAALAVWVHGRRTGTGFDTRVLRELYFRLGPNAAEVTLAATNETIVLTAIAFAALACLLLRRVEAAVLVVVTPVAAVALTEFVLKPIIGRRFGAGGGGDELSPYAFPSGHTAALTGFTAAMIVLVLRAPISRAARAAAVALLAGWTVVGAVGLVRNGYHYATDTIGAVLVSVACALATALAIDAVRRLS